MMVHDTVIVMNIAQTARPAHPANCMTVSIAVGVRIGFMLLALAGKSSTAILLVTDTWSPKCINVSLGSLLSQEDSQRRYCIHAGKTKSLKTQHSYLGLIVLWSNRHFVLGLLLNR
jgi:hypothetical protein